MISTVRTVAFFWVSVCSIDLTVSRGPPPQRRPPVIDKHPFAAPSRRMGQGIQFASIPSKLFCPALSLTSAIKENQCGGTHRRGCRADSERSPHPPTAGTDQSAQGGQTIDYKYVCFFFHFLSVETIRPDGYLVMYVVQHNALKTQTPLPDWIRRLGTCLPGHWCGNWCTENKKKKSPFH